MGGQACILYGGAEFSRDIDFAIAASPADLKQLKRALRELKADPIFLPPLSATVLRRGHACHFRCQAPGVEGLRIDVMGRMRGADPFHRLWKRRFEAVLPGLGRIPVVSLADLVRIKKTQRDKDWVMIRRMLEANFARHEGAVDDDRVRFWLREVRTAPILMHLVRTFPVLACELRKERAALRAAVLGKKASLLRALTREENVERRKDREYWRPLRRELEAWQLGRQRRPRNASK